jgi:glycosyltransferase involved in cell wall biosynthesis
MTAGRVLFLSGLQVYPTISGGTLRSFALAGGLRRRGFDVRVHALTGRRADYVAGRPSGGQAWPDGTEEHVDRGLSSLAAWLTGYLLRLPPVWMSVQLAAAAASPGEVLLSPALREKLRWCDVVVSDFPFLHPIFSAPSASGKLRVLSTHNVEHRLLAERGIGPSRMLRALVRALEIRAANACDILVACCPDDARFFESEARVGRTVVVPNGIDPRRFRETEVHRARTRRELGLGDDVKVFLFTASKWGPNREAFELLLRFAKAHSAFLADQKIHILVVGKVAAAPIRLPGLTTTGRVDVVEPYFAAADAALNPMLSGAGTNVKMGEFLAARLPILTTRFGARGFQIEDGETGFLFEEDTLAPVLARVRRLFDEDPARLRRIAASAYAANEPLIDMDVCVGRLAEAVGEARARSRAASPATLLSLCPPSESV